MVTNGTAIQARIAELEAELNAQASRKFNYPDLPML